MKTVALIFFVCLSLFAIRFVACEAEKGDNDGPSYEDVLKNSINHFLHRRQISRQRMRGTGRIFAVNLEKIPLHWTASRGSFNIEMNNTTLTVDPNYFVSGVSLRGHRENSAISLILNFTIPKAVIGNATWYLQGTWFESVNGSGDFSIVYKNISARVQIDVELKNEIGFNFWHTKNIYLDTFDSFRNDKAEPIPILDELPEDIPVRRMKTEMKRSVASQLEATLMPFFEELFSACSWKRFILGQF